MGHYYKYFIRNKNVSRVNTQKYGVGHYKKLCIRNNNPKKCIKGKHTKTWCGTLQKILEIRVQKIVSRVNTRKHIILIISNSWKKNPTIIAINYYITKLVGINDRVTFFCSLKQLLICIRISLLDLHVSITSPVDFVSYSGEKVRIFQETHMAH